MRSLLLWALMGLSFGCGDGDGSAPANDACAAAIRVQEEAWTAANDMAPPCEDDGDCVVFLEQAQCPGHVEIAGCEQPVHRDVLDLYDVAEVSRRMCEVAEDSPYGCSVVASCATHGAPVCRAGACAFADP